MTDKQYLVDSYATSFTASVVSCRQGGGNRWRAILEKTWFYPESGGQPADRGTIGDARVLDVQLEDDTVVHILDGQVSGRQPAAIDWPRRHDHMQQHSGQHLLSAAAIELFDASTVGFHLGERISTIDLTINSLPARQIEKLEALCQQLIAQVLPITAATITRQEFDRMDLRKKAIPDHVSGEIRMVGMGDVDLCHCGGTHLRSTAEIQLIKIITTEKVRDTTRVHFLAGERAVRDYSLKHELVNDLSFHFTTGVEDLKQIVLKQQRENKAHTARLKAAHKELSGLLAEKEVRQAKPAGGHLLVARHYPGLGTEMLQALARGITRLEPAMIFCGLTSDGNQQVLICAAGKSYQGDLGQVVQQINPLFEGRGGGRGSFARAAGKPGNESKIIERIEAMFSGTSEDAASE